MSARTIDQLCAESHLSYQDLARQAGLDESTTHAIILGRWTPSPEERDRIAAVFGLTRRDIAWGHKTPIQHLYGHGPG